jgi:hypothetical protein
MLYNIKKQFDDSDLSLALISGTDGFMNILDFTSFGALFLNLFLFVGLNNLAMVFQNL